MMEQVFEFLELESCDLVVDAVYRAGKQGTLAEEPLNRLLRCGNMGGFRVRGGGNIYQLVVLFTTFDDPDWPDTLDRNTGRFLYFGDNKTAGRELHATPKGGNDLLRRCFEWIHVIPSRRERVPPFFVFSKVDKGRDVRFHGLAVPGATDATESEDLIAIWKTVGSARFQNYRAVFTILDVPRIPRAWLDELPGGAGIGPHAPDAWRDWVLRGIYRPLTPA